MTFNFKKLAVMAGVLVVTGQAAGAASLLWNFDNEINSNISIEFYSQDRNHVWPGDGQVYILGPTDGARTYNLECSQGENICYGGWIRGDDSSYWGSGKNDKESCDGCCAICGGGDVDPIDLIR